MGTVRVRVRVRVNDNDKGGTGRSVVGDSSRVTLSVPASSVHPVMLRLGVAEAVMLKADVDCKVRVPIFELESEIMMR